MSLWLTVLRLLRIDRMQRRQVTNTDGKIADGLTQCSCWGHCQWLDSRSKITCTADLDMRDSVALSRIPFSPSFREVQRLPEGVERRSHNWGISNFIDMLVLWLLKRRT
jgi:hypothetical protein